MRVRLMALVAIVAIALAGQALAQETTGAVNGRVTDSQGLAVPGASVTLTGPQGSKTVVTDSDGRYQAPLLVPGTYTIRAELQGFKAVEQKDVVRPPRTDD